MRGKEERGVRGSRAALCMLTDCETRHGDQCEQAGVFEGIMQPLGNDKGA